MIFAAGLGTRLKPLTDTIPKAMVRVGGEPLLRRVIEELAASGFTRIVVNVHHFASQIITYLQENDSFGLDITVSDESALLLDTGGGIRKAQGLFDPRCPILIHNVDILSNVNLERFYGLDPRVLCRDCGAPHLLAGAQLLVSWRKTKRYLLFNDDMLLVGWVNVETGEVRSPWPELKAVAAKQSFPIVPGDAPMRLADIYPMYAFSGIHTLSSCLFPYMVGWPERFPIMDFYLKTCRQVPIRGVVKSDLRLMDVGKLDALQDAEEFIKRLSKK